MDLKINRQNNSEEPKEEKDSKIIGQEEGPGKLDINKNESKKEEFEIPVKVELGKKINKEKKEDKGDTFYAEAIKKRIDIHVMPEKFRLNRQGAENAQKTGLIIIVSGAIFLILLSIMLYVFLFKEKSDGENVPLNNFNNDDVPVVIKKEIKKDNEDQGSVKDNDVQDNDSSKGLIATSTDKLVATSSPDKIIASSTPEQKVEADLDNDGLSSKEELILGTSNTNVNSDGDNYNDNVELENLYNPAGSGKLIDNPNIIEYKNDYYNYKILYPLLWKKVSVGGDDSLMFSSDDGHFIQIIAQENSREQNIEEWLAEQLGEEAANLNNKVEKEEWTGIKNSESNIIYITDSSKKYIFVISYSFGVDSFPVYKNIYNMVVNSFEIESL